MIDYITGGEYLNVTSSNGSKPYINKSFKDLLDQIKLKEDQLKMVETLLKSSGNEGVIQTKPLRF